MAKYHINTKIKSAKGFQTWEIEADSSDNALELFKNGEGNVVEEEIEITSLEIPDIDDVELVE